MYLTMDLLEEDDDWEEEVDACVEEDEAWPLRATKLAIHANWRSLNGGESSPACTSCGVGLSTISVEKRKNCAGNVTEVWTVRFERTCV